MDMSVRDDAISQVAMMVATEPHVADDAMLICHLRVPHSGEVDAKALASAIDAAGAEEWLDAVREADAIGFETPDPE